VRVFFYFFVYTYVRLLRIFVLIEYVRGGTRVEIVPKRRTFFYRVAYTYSVSMKVYCNDIKIQLHTVVRTRSIQLDVSLRISTRGTNDVFSRDDAT